MLSSRILWLLAQMRQPGRSIYEDFDRTTFSDFLDTLLDRDNFNFYKEVEGQRLFAPRHSVFLTNWRFREEATMLCKEGVIRYYRQLSGRRSRILSIVWKHWLQLVAITNAPSSSSSRELQTLKKRISDLEKARSRSPRRNAQKQKAISSGPTMLSLPAPSAPAPSSKGGKGKSNRRKAKGAGKSAASSSAVRQQEFQFNYIMNIFLPLFDRISTSAFTKGKICFSFRKNSCTIDNCKFAHVCLGFGGPKPSDLCRCLTNKIPLSLHISVVLRSVQRFYRCLLSLQPPLL